jgi:putative addiction module antidote
MIALKLRKIGNSAGVILPQAVLEALHVAAGDTLFLTASSEGYRLTPYSPAFKTQMTLAHKIKVKRQNALRDLAK